MATELETPFNFQLFNFQLTSLITHSPDGYVQTVAFEIDDNRIRTIYSVQQSGQAETPGVRMSAAPGNSIRATLLVRVIRSRWTASAGTAIPGKAL